MSATSSALLDSQLRSKKRRYSALELLTISPPHPEDAKRPRILEVDGDPPGTAAGTGVAASPDPATERFPAAERFAADDRWSSSASASDVEPAAKHHRPRFSHRIDWQPTPHTPEDSRDDIEVDDQDADVDAADYTSSSGLSDDEDDTSSSSSSSSGESAAARDHHHQLLGPDPVFLPRGSPPPWRMAVTPPPSAAPSDLQTRLRAFLPAMYAANAELEAERTAAGGLGHRAMEVDGAVIQVTPPSDSEGGAGSGMERGDGDCGAPLIEMDLGLGVLEERQPGDESDDDDSLTSDSSSSSASSVAGDQGAARERDVVGRLMGHRRARPAIEVLGDAP